MQKTSSNEKYLRIESGRDLFYSFGNYMFKVNDRNTTEKCEICSRLTIETPEQRQWREWRRSGVFIVNFEHF